MRDVYKRQHMTRDKIKPILFSIIKHQDPEQLKRQIPRDIVAGIDVYKRQSVASLILITEATVSDVPKNTQLEDAIAAATAGAQGGGMY